MAKSLICCIGLSSCAGTPTQIDGHQYLAVDAGASKNITLIPAREINCAEDDEECQSSRIELNKLQEKFESCIARGLGRTAPNVTLVKKAQQQKSPYAIDYSVKITIENSVSEKRVYTESDGKSPLWGIGQSWTKTARVYSRIYDADTQNLAGELTANLSKKASWSIPVLLVIPLPIPLGYVPNVEDTSCKEMGEALGRFFMGAGNNYIR